MWLHYNTTANLQLNNTLHTPPPFVVFSFTCKFSSSPQTLDTLVTIISISLNYPLQINQQTPISTRPYMDKCTPTIFNSINVYMATPECKLQDVKLIT